MNDDALNRIAEALERISPKPLDAPDFFQKQKLTFGKFHQIVWIPSTI